MTLARITLASGRSVVLTNPELTNPVAEFTNAAIRNVAWEELAEDFEL